MQPKKIKTYKGRNEGVKKERISKRINKELWAIRAKIWEINQSQLFNQIINWSKISFNKKEKKSFNQKKRWIRTDKIHPQPTKSTASKIRVILQRYE